jgi:predicted kinase
MKDLFPQPPDWRVRWDDFDARFPWIHRMRGCPQDPVHHAEGDVWTHARLVCEALASDPKWRALPPHERDLLFTATLMHDIAKPACSRSEGGRIHSPRHAHFGAIETRSILWDMDWPPEEREAVAGLVRHHMSPYLLVEKDDAVGRLHFISQSARCDWLAMLSRADVHGRICEDQQRLFDNLDRFEELAVAQECLTSPRAFPSEHSRFLYFRKQAGGADCRSEMILLSGLPGCGKDKWIAEAGPDWPVVSLDVSCEETDGSTETAREVARGHFTANTSFIWNATNLSRAMRAQAIDLAAAFQAKIRIVAIEAPAAALRARNAAREPVLERMLARWEYPDLTEAHAVERVALPLSAQ